MLLRKGVYPYEYMDDWEKFNETTLPEKKEFYTNLEDMLYGRYDRHRLHACEKSL